MTPPCFRCGTAHGRAKRAERSPIRYNARRYGLDGQVCAACYNALDRAHRRGPGSVPTPPTCRTEGCANRYGGRNPLGLCTICCERWRLRQRNRTRVPHGGRRSYTNDPAKVSEAEAVARTAAVRELGMISLLDRPYQPLERPATAASVAVTEYRRAELSMARIRAMAL